jgi:xylan 1,4-beta-xylosidase
MITRGEFCRDLNKTAILNFLPSPMSITSPYSTKWLYIMKQLKHALVAVTILLLSLMGMSCGDNDTEPVFLADGNVTVDFSLPVADVKSMSGIIHGMNADEPASQMISDLGPAYWRAGTLMTTIYPRLESFGATPILGLSDIYRYPGDNIAGWEQPFSNYTKWQDFVGNVFTNANAQSNSFVYEIWNEPGGSYFWTGTRQQFFETFKVAHNKIRSLPGGEDALICGPSLAGIDTAYIHQFLDYCLANSIKLDVLSWHDFKSGSKIANLENDLFQVRSKWVNSLKYAPLQIKEIHINEMTSEEEQFAPGSILAFLSALEKGKADAACRACWNESTGINNCFNNTLNGLLVPGTSNPRAAWWAYRFYNLSTKERVESSSTLPEIVSFASLSSDSPQAVQVLLGYFGDAGALQKNLQLTLNNLHSVTFLSTKKKVNVEILRVPNSGENVLTNPELVSETEEDIDNIGSITIDISKFNLKEAYVVKIF